MRGNYFGISLLIFCNSGSPPRARELLIMIENSTVDQGITPACAGITGIGGIKELLARGSPPRARELLIPQYLLTFTDRITPANAGSTYNSSRTHFHLQDHHRVCGNYDSLVWATRQELKSPPRARELLGQLRVLVLFVGITPACAEILNINQYIAIKLVHKSLIYSGQFL